MRIFFAHEVSYQDKVIFEMHEFPEILASRSHEVYFYDFPENLSKRGFYSRGRTRIISGRVRQDSKLHLISPSTLSFGMLQRIFVMPYSLFHIFRKLHSLKPDVIVTYAVPTYGLQILLLGKLFKIPIVYRAIDVSHLIRKSTVSAVVKVIEGIVIKRSDFISCNNLAMRNYVISRGAKPADVFLNYAPVDFDHFKNTGDFEIINLKNLFFLGTLFPFTGLEQFISTAHRNNLFLEGYTLTIVGSGERYEPLVSLVRALGLDESIRFTGLIPYSDLSSYFGEAGIALNPFIKSTLTDIALPHKVIQYAAAARPIVSTPLEGLTGLFDVDETVFWAKTPEEMIERIREINRTPIGVLEARIKLQSQSLKTKSAVSAVIDSFESVLDRAIHSDS
jgi:glycosyltransferase involved in cell wall biosynthesis